MSHRLKTLIRKILHRRTNRANIQTTDNTSRGLEPTDTPAHCIEHLRPAGTLSGPSGELLCDCHFIGHIPVNLTPDMRLRFSLLPKGDTISTVRLRFGTHQRINTCHVVLRLGSVEETFSAEGLPDNQWVDLPLTHPVTCVPDEPIQIECYSPDANQHNCVALWCANLPTLAPGPPWKVPALPDTPSPQVSVVIPVFNKALYTYNCLRAVLATDTQVSREIIIVDNASTDGTSDLLNVLQGGFIRICNSENRGFVEACRQGAAAARGDYIVFLNNDTQVRSNWLGSMLNMMHRNPGVGIVGSKLIYPDGRLQEAGGIIFNDASGWNYGRLADPQDTRFTRSREVDYCSGASLMIRRYLWRQLGGFDLRYAPAYYEDTDLCFAARRAGYRVMYCHESEVIHYEGVTAGTDTSSGCKAFQVENAPKFREKWKSVLRNHFPPPPATDPEKAAWRLHSQQGIITLVFSEISSYTEYVCHKEKHHDIDLKKWLVEKSLIPGGRTEFTVKGYCYVCQSNVDFWVDFEHAYTVDNMLTPNWRERLICPGCHLNNRMRAAMHLFDMHCKPKTGASIYLTEQTTLLYNWFKKNFPDVIGSEYLGDTVSYGSCNNDGIRNETLARLSFMNEAFDYILSFDVFEHIPNYKKALTECSRCLKPQGVLFFSVPFEKASEKNIIRARISQSGEIIHLLPAEYHGDPLCSDGSLSYYIFGWEILDDLKMAGFQSSKALLYWSRELGYLGGEQLLLAAVKDSRS